MGKMLYIVNFYAGKSRARRSLGAVTEYFTRNGWDVTVHPTLAPLDAKKTVLKSGHSYDMIVCSGGDGTLNEVISGILELPERPMLGYIPSGSANDTANSLGLPLEPLKAAEIVLNGRSFTLDVGRFNDRIFVYVAAFGAFSEVSYSTPQNLKNNLGNVAYVLEALRRLPKIHSFHMKIDTDEGVFEDDFIFGAVTNTLSVGGGILKLDPGRVALNDGLLEVLFIRGFGNLNELSRTIASINNRDFSDEHIIFVKSKSVVCSAPEPVPWTLDGEDGGSHTSVNIRCLHNPVTIMAGK